MFQNDPFSGHVVIRSTDAAIAGSRYRLWTTVKVPQGYSIQSHCQMLSRITGAISFKLMPAKRLFALGVGHVRRRGMEPGSKSDDLADVTDTQIAQLSDHEWRVLIALKREFEPDELLQENLWKPRAAEADVNLDEFLTVARSLNQRGVIGPVLDLSGTCQTAQHRRARYQIQRAVSLGGARRTRDRNRPAGWSIPHHDSCLLARGRR